MTIKSYPWARTGGGQYEAQTHTYEREMYARLWNNDGVIAGSRFEIAGTGAYNDESCVVFESSPADLFSNVQLGAIMLKGSQARITAVETVEHTQNLSGNPRIDAVYLKRDDAVQTFSVLVSEGTPAASPSPTLLTDTATEFYYLLALITLPSGGNVTTANIVNVRRFARPVGSLRAGKINFAASAGSAFDEDELELDGSVLKQDAYPDLFAAIGSSFNTGGEAADEFRLPDMRGRSAIGVGTGSGLSARALGDTGGAEEHTLIESELPTHTHALEYESGTADNGSEPQAQVQYARAAAPPYFTTTNGMQPVGSDAPHENMPPFLALSAFIKV